MLLDKCEHCHGHSLRLSYDYLCRKVMAALKRLFANKTNVGAIVSVNDKMAAHMITSRFFAEVCENEWSGKRIYLISDNMLSDEFRIKGCTESAFTVPGRGTLLY